MNNINSWDVECQIKMYDTEFVLRCIYTIGYATMNGYYYKLRYYGWFLLIKLRHYYE